MVFSCSHVDTWSQGWRRIRLSWKESSVFQNSKKVFSADKPKGDHYWSGSYLKLDDSKKNQGEGTSRAERGRKFLVKGIAGARVWTWKAWGEGWHCSLESSYPKYFQFREELELWGKASLTGKFVSECDYIPLIHIFFSRKCQHYYICKCKIMCQ